MWKIFFEYNDNSKCTVTGKQKDIPLRLAVKYHKQYGFHATSAMYQQYPKKEHEPMSLVEKIAKLEKESELGMKKPYPIGSQWLFKAENLKIAVKITKYFLPNLMLIESTETEGEFRMYSCSREVSWFADKLFPLHFAEGE